MPMQYVMESAHAMLRSTCELSQVQEALSNFSGILGFDYFALTHHIDFSISPDGGVRLHNYPSQFEEWFDARALGRTDPIHRASHVASFGFTWSSVPSLIQMTPSDHEVLAEARRMGIGDGYTVPANVPGEYNGSCSFAVQFGAPFPSDHVLLAQVIGGLAFEAARRIGTPRRSTPPILPLTDRQRDCILWAARGKTDWEISCILGVSQDTVIQHLKHARERYGVTNRAHLAVMALFDGAICFSEVFPPPH
jgi:DNA-binding CsgD family transcriptional regulator